MTLAELANLTTPIALAASAAVYAAGRLFGRGAAQQRTTERDIERVEKALEAHRDEARQAAVASRAEFASRCDRIDTTLDRISSGLGSLRQTVAVHDAQIEALGGMAARRD